MRDSTCAGIGTRLALWSGASLACHYLPPQFRGGSPHFTRSARAWEAACVAGPSAGPLAWESTPFLWTYLPSDPRFCGLQTANYCSGEGGASAPSAADHSHLSPPVRVTASSEGLEKRGKPQSGPFNTKVNSQASLPPALSHKPGADTLPHSYQTELENFISSPFISLSPLSAPPFLICVLIKSSNP